MRVADFDFDLPPELIAQFPAAERGASRLLHVDADGGLHDRMFRALPALLRPDDLLVMNDTRVIKARLFGAKDSELKQWTITDPQGYDTTVAVFNLSRDQKPDPSLFRIEYMRMQ